MTVGHANKYVFEVGEGLDVVKLCGGDKGAEGRPGARPAIGSGEQVVFAAECDGADGAFHGVGVEFDASVIEEPAEVRAMTCAAKRCR